MDLSGCGKIRQTAVESFTYEDVQINYFEHLDHLRETKDLAANKPTYLAYLAFRALLFGQDGCPTFAKAYVGRKRRAKPHHSLCHTGNK
jgi:hypothetical protein